MGYGLAFPQREIGNDPGAIRAFVQTAEALGFERLTVVDHVLGAPEPAPDDPDWAPGYVVAHSFHEPMTLLAFIAACTRTIRLVTANIILPQRQTVLVAKPAFRTPAMVCAAASRRVAGLDRSFGYAFRPAPCGAATWTRRRPWRA